MKFTSLIYLGVTAGVVFMKYHRLFSNQSLFIVKILLSSFNLFLAPAATIDQFVLKCRHDCVATNCLNEASTIGGQKFGTSCFGNILAGLLKRVKNALSNWRRLGLTMDRLSLEIGITKMGAKTCVLRTCVCVCARVRVCVCG